MQKYYEQVSLYFEIQEFYWSKMSRKNFDSWWSLKNIIEQIKNIQMPQKTRKVILKNWLTSTQIIRKTLSGISFWLDFSSAEEKWQEFLKSDSFHCHQPHIDKPCECCFLMVEISYRRLTHVRRFFPFFKEKNWENLINLLAFIELSVNLKVSIWVEKKANISVFCSIRVEWTRRKFN